MSAIQWDLIEEAKKIISIHSITYESNREIVEYISSLLEPLDVKIVLQKGELYGKEQLNVLGIKGPEHEGALLMTTHLDTVSPGDYSLWDKTGGNPFRATIEENKIYGLGAADVKLDILCKIKALEKFKGVEFKNPLIVAGTYGEESGLAGAQQLSKELNMKIQYALVGEPSNLSIVYAHKGFLSLEFSLTDSQATELLPGGEIYRIDFQGRAAHSSTPHLGINAVQKAIDFLKGQKGTSDLIGLQGGELINVIPDRATLYLRSSQKITHEGNGLQIAVQKQSEPAMVFSPSFMSCFEELQGIFRKLVSEFKQAPMTEFDPPTSLLNVGVISTEKNKIKFWLGIRFLPSVDPDQLLTDKIEKPMQAIGEKYPQIKLEMRVFRKSLPMHTDPSSKLVVEAKNALRTMGLQETMVTKATSTEASVYRAMGAEAIVWGPGVSVGNVHKPNEFNYLHHLHHAVRFYEKMIESFCVKGVR